MDLDTLNLEMRHKLKLSRKFKQASQFRDSLWLLKRRGGGGGEGGSSPHSAEQHFKISSSFKIDLNFAFFE